MSSPLPNSSLPILWCDFNACSWSGDATDNCYYAFDRQALETLAPVEGMRLFVYDNDGDGDGEVVGCEAQLERYEGAWRLRPVEQTWFRGRLPSGAD